MIQFANHELWPDRGSGSETDGEQINTVCGSGNPSELRGPS